MVECAVLSLGWGGSFAAMVVFDVDAWLGGFEVKAASGKPIAHRAVVVQALKEKY